MILNLFLIAFAILLLSSVIRGAPFVPTHQRRVARMVELSGILPGQKSADLGSGDGRIVIAMARAGATAQGYEINPFLVWWSRWKIRRSGLQDQAFIHFGSFWGKNLSEFDVVTLFGTTHIMKGLERKLKKELKPGARVISYVFAFPTWDYTQKDGAIFVYRR
jgi:2-polyprenyl-3-methyl-5-hydroxy-6-metoxy-1,4-benzoquinol methylase